MVVRAVPKGRVLTYGQVALLGGKPHGAREVGWICHAGGTGIPWHRVVNRAGGLASGYAGGRAGHRRALKRDGVRVGRNARVDLDVYGWWPDPRSWKRLALSTEIIARLAGVASTAGCPRTAPKGRRP